MIDTVVLAVLTDDGGGDGRKEAIEVTVMCMCLRRDKECRHVVHEIVTVRGGAHE